MICAACGAAAPEIARFCPSCGRLLRARADERRVVTVLFADIVGFTALAETRDPEQVKNLLDRCFARLAADVTAYGGRVDKIMGDAIIAFFGAPIAHEDDAERAVRAGLQMQRSLADETGPLSSSTMTGSDDGGPEVALRIGLNTGEVLVGAVWAGGDATVLGDVVNVASRLQTAAAPGQVVVGEATWAATSQVIRYRSLGPVQARGRGELVDAWVATGVLAPPGHRPARPVTPLVGRDEEFGILCGALATATRRRRAHLVLLLGEAGIGKSRLAEELALEARQEHGALMLEGRCLPYGEANVWWPFAEALRQACSIEPSDSGETSAAKVLTAVAKATNLDEDAADAQRLADGILHLLGDDDALPDVDRGRAREEAKRAVLSFLEALARQRPLVLVLSELHWADDLVLTGIDRLLERMRALPFVLIATARPELERRWTPAPGRHNSVILTLDPLDEVAAAALLTSLFGSDPPDELRHVLLERGGGNPFFLEELAALLGRGSTGTGEQGTILPEGLPATLRGLVSARLDALGPGDRAVLEDAGVIGRSGPLETLEALAVARGESDACTAIDRLVHADLLTVDEDEWAFRSELVREVAYETLTKAERARRHSTLADLLSQRMRELDREDEELEQLAHHYGTAAALAGELGSVEGVPTDLGQRALDTVTRAATRAEERDLHETAARLLDQAADLATRWGGPAERRKVLLSRASVRATLYRLDEARSDLAEAQASAEADGDLMARARAMTVLGYTLHKDGHLDTAVEALEQAIDLWQQAGDRLGEAEALRIIGMAHLMADDADSAEAPISASLAISQDLHARRGEAWALQNLAWIAFQRGQITLAEERLNESLIAFADTRDYGGVGWALGLLGWIRFFQGRRDEAESLAEQILVELEGSGDHWGRAMMAVLLANVRLWNGKTAEAVTRAEEAEVVFKSHGDVPGQFRALSPLVRGLVALGRISEGLQWLDHAVEVAARLSTDQRPGFGAHLNLNVAVQLGDSARGARQLEQLAALSGAIETDPSELGWAEFAGHVALAELQQGRPDEAVRRLEHAVRMAQEDPSGYLTSALALAYATAGRPADALAAAKNNDNDARSTYLDDATALAARGFASIQLGDRAEAVVAFDSAVARVDGTDDVVAQAVFRMARALGTTDVEELDLVRERLGHLGITADGWATAFGIAAHAG